MTLLLVISLLLCYLAGAIPFGYLLTRRSTGLNIMEHGSGNIGSTNVGRIAGKRIAIQVQMLDMLKGFLPVALVLLVKKYGCVILPHYFIYLVALSTIIGHNFSIFLRFRGGKGVNTTLGATILLAPAEVLCAVTLYFVVKSLYKFVSLGSMALAITLPLVSFLISSDSMLSGYLVVVGLMILIRHHSNIYRLITGKEFRSNFK